jgi:hypothetical protein
MTTFGVAVSVENIQLCADGHVAFVMSTVLQIRVKVQVRLFDAFHDCVTGCRLVVMSVLEAGFVVEAFAFVVLTKVAANVVVIDRRMSTIGLGTSSIGLGMSSFGLRTSKADLGTSNLGLGTSNLGLDAILRRRSKFGIVGFGFGWICDDDDCSNCNQNKSNYLHSELQN